MYRDGSTTKFYSRSRCETTRTDGARIVLVARNKARAEATLARLRPLRIFCRSHELASLKDIRLDLSSGRLIEEESSDARPLFKLLLTIRPFHMGSTNQREVLPWIRP